MKGRLLPYIYQCATSHLDELLAEVSSWSAGRYANDVVLWQECVTAVKFTVSLARASLAEYDTIPLLFARLREPGIRDRVLAQWHEAPPHQHHRCSRRVLDPSGQLGRDIRAMSADGSGMSPALDREVQVYMNMPIHDEVGEGPHATMSKNLRSASGSRWAWGASSLRLDDNLEDAQWMPQALGKRIDPAWPSFARSHDGERRAPTQEAYSCGSAGFH